MSNNHKNSFCPFAEQLVSHLYGEADAAESYKFRAHLETCAPCADELESFGFVRAAVSEWRDAEFSPTPTPAFSIPNYQADKSRSVAFAATENRSWFAEFRQLFAFNPATAMAAFGVLAVGIGLFWFAFNSDKQTDVAEKVTDKNIAQAFVSPTIEVTKKPEAVIVAEQNIEKSSPKPLEVKSKSETAPVKSVVKVSNIVTKNNADDSIRKPENAANAVKKTTPVKKPAIPNLNDTEDEADETIRLADLFAELDTK